VLNNLLVLAILSLYLGYVGRVLLGSAILPFVHYLFAILAGLIALRAIWGHNEFSFSSRLVLYGKLRTIALLIVCLLLVLLLSGIFHPQSLPFAPVYFLVIAEPWILFMAAMVVVGRSNDARSERKEPAFIGYLWVLIGVSALVAIGQHFLLGYRHDDVRGLFIGTGAGSHILGGVMAALPLYSIPLLLKRRVSSRRKLAFFAMAIMGVLVAILSDTKQLLFIMLVVLALYGLWIAIKSSIGTPFKIAVLLAGFIVMTTAWSYLGGQINMDTISLGIEWKFSVVSTIERLTDYDLANLFLGFGAGQTVSKVAMMIADYQPLFYQLGLTVAPSDLSATMWQMNQNYWVSNSVTGSSLYSQFFSWGGVFGDLGLFGLLALVGILLVVFSIPSVSARLLLIYYFLAGFLFIWLEEPAFTSTISLLIALSIYEDLYRT
jgi:hypothetical protein